MYIQDWPSDVSGIIDNTEFHEKNARLEIKISSGEGRFKKGNPIVDQIKLEKFLSKGLTDNRYGHCKPILNISYDRDYYSIGDCRITIDRNISYWNYKNNNNPES